MATHSSPVVVNPGTFVVSKGAKTVFSVSIFLGVLALAYGLLRDRDRAWHAYLVGAFFFANMALGGLFFAAINHIAKAGWSVTVRRIAESFTGYLPIAFVTFLVLVVGAGSLYEWTNTEVAHADPLIAAKTAYLNLPFFIIRLFVFFGAWLLFKHLIIGSSLKQDKTGDEKITIKQVGYSIGFILVFALSYSLFSVDTLMSLEPHFFSTIWGVYCFAGLFQAFFAATILVTIYLMNKGVLRGLVNENHLHDLAKFLKAFTVFYAYIAFSQFMLIWYANLPEETFFYIDRTMGGWMAATASLFIFKFAVPFLLLLPRWAKRTPSHLVFVSCLILIMQYVDIHWMVYPNLNKEHWIFGPLEIGAFLFFGGMFLWSILNFLSKNAVVPVKDPRIEESIRHVVTY
ncbi:MAG: molybdopterin oxidoreductase [Bdellovibrionaceae bacterium]|nr:molybdopterin oxidoreductase [Pseudobdellovibrionaceae bacterium]